MNFSGRLSIFFPRVLFVFLQNKKKLFSHILFVLFFRRDLSDGFCVSGIKQEWMGVAVSVSV